MRSLRLRTRAPAPAFEGARSPLTFEPAERKRRTRGGAARLIACAALALLAACTQAPAGPVVTVHAEKGDVAVVVEVARTPEELSRGLMWRTEVPDGTGMLFIFQDENERSFWMRNTPTSLDILYIRADATILSIARRTRPYSEDSIPSRGPARYVLEVPAGWSDRHGVRPGDRVTLPAE